MKHVSIIVPKGDFILSSVIGAFKVFNGVNNYLKLNKGYTSNFFNVELVGITKETQLYDGAFSVKPHKLIEDVKKTDLIIVSTIYGDIKEEIKRNYPFVNWIKEQRLQNHADIASLCIGSFLLAETGLLDGKSCSTHWASAQNFALMYPKVKLKSEKIIVEDNGIYSSGGSYSFLNLMLHLIEKYCGREAAIWCSKMFEIDFDRENQDQFLIFNGQKDHDDEIIIKAQNYIEKNYSKKIIVKHVADMLAVSQRNFVRRFKKATANSPLEYIQRVKIEAAKKDLESTTININEVMYNVGYSDTKSFRNIFKKYTGMSPLDYKIKFNRMVL